MDITCPHGPRQPRDLLDAPPPADDAAEIALVGGLLAKPEWVTTALADLPPEAFRLRHCRRIWRAAKELAEAGLEIDLHSIGQQLAKRRALDDVGGAEGLKKLLWYGQPGYAEGFARRVDHASALREVLHIAEALIQAVYREDWHDIESAGQWLGKLAARVRTGAKPQKRRRLQVTGRTQ